MILIDDFEAGLRHLSPLGKSILFPEIEAIYQDILSFAQSHAWTVISYPDFVAWLQNTAGNQFENWVVLDKVFPRETLSGKSFFVDLHRNLDTSAQTPTDHFLNLGAVDQPLPQKWSGSIAIIDDGIYTGTTLFKIVELLENQVESMTIFTAVAKKKALDRLNAHPKVKGHCLTYVGQGMDILHLRDFFPLFPFAGRKIMGSPLRLCAALYQAGEWLHLQEQAVLKKAIGQHQKAALAKFRQQLGRTLQLEDLALLGQGIGLQLSQLPSPVSVQTDHSIDQYLENYS